MIKLYTVLFHLDVMKKELLTFVVYICIDQTILGSPTLTCDSVDPISTSFVKCTCTYSAGIGIKWYTDGVSITQCFKANELCFNSAGYNFSVNSVTSTYTMVYGPYQYTSCANVSCSDLVNDADYDDKDISINESNLKAILVLSEPTANHTNGNITFTTDCLYKAGQKPISVIATWKAIINEVEEKDLEINALVSENKACQFCRQDYATQFSFGFFHTEETSEEKIEAKIRLVLLFNGYSIPSLNRTTEHLYYVKGTNVTSVSNTVTSILKSSSPTMSVANKSTATTPERYVSSVVKSVTWCIFSEDISVCIHIIWVVIVVSGIIVSAVVVWIKVKKGSTQEEFHAVKVEKTSIKVCWKRCDKNQSSERVYILNLLNNNSIEITDDGGKSFFHTFSNLQHSTFYYITLNCADKTDLSTIYKYKALEVRTKGVPEVPSNFRVEKHDVTISSMRVRWTPGNDGGCMQTFVLTCSTKSRNIEIEIEHNGEEDMSYEWENLSEGTYYDLELRAKNLEGSCSRIQPLKKRTLGKPDLPVNFKAIDVTEKSMEVKWQAGSNGGYPQSFKLLVLKNSEEVLEEHEVHERNEISNYHVLLKHLTSSTDYTLNLKTRNLKGTVEFKEPLHVRTKGKPGQPTRFRYEEKDITDTSITVRWNPGSDEGYEQTFVVTILGKGFSSQSERIADNGGKDAWMKRWTQLSKATNYDVSIYAENKAGKSDKQKLTIKTLASKPDPPTEFRVVEDGITETSIKLQWEPGHDGGCKQKIYVIINKKEYEAKENGKYTCESLTPNTYYDIDLKAKNKIGEVMATTLRHIRTDGPPDRPSDFEMVSRTHSTIIMKWEPGYDGGFPQHFILVDVISGEKLTDPIKDTADHTMQHIITNLKEGKEFKLQVQASNKLGKSNSKTVTVKTIERSTADK